MAVTHGKARLELTRSQVLQFRRGVGLLDDRLPAGAKSLRRAAWAGLQDSMPRAALLSIHARVEKTGADILEHPSLVQLWGPRFNVYVVAAEDVAAFSLGRLPQDKRGLARAQQTADCLHAALNGKRIPFGHVGHAMSVPPNSLRYAAATGTVLLCWDGARQPDIWTAPPPKATPEAARQELVRRYLHIFGPSTAASFARWAGVRPADANAAFKTLVPQLLPVRTLAGDGWILAEDEAAFRAKPKPAAPARLLPSGDAFYLAWGADREILVPDAKRQAQLWTSRVWPGAVVVSGEISGVWRRAAEEISIDMWRSLSRAEREAVEAEAISLPLPGLKGPIKIRWN